MKKINKAVNLDAHIDALDAYIEGGEADQTYINNKFQILAARFKLAEVKLNVVQLANSIQDTAQREEVLRLTK